MIKQIIKRDGSEEPFKATKLNGWGMYAAENLGNYVDWSSIVMATVSSMPETVTSQELQLGLIRNCIYGDSWSHYLMAGKLYAPYLHKNIHGDKIPTVLELHEKLYSLGFMVRLDYTFAEYAEIEAMINHDLDKLSAHFELHHVREKYSLQNRITGEEYETQQFVYMRMAMALAEKQPHDRRMADVRAFYRLFSQKRLSAPTPNYVNLGTPLRGYSSCCVFTTLDDAFSLAIGDHIAYIMTCMSAGIGSHINTRSIDDPVRGGLIKHQGRLPYYRAQVGATKANLQNGRGGANTTHYQTFDPEAHIISMLKNPLSVEDKKIRGIDYSATTNKFFARKAAREEQVFAFNSFTAPDLWDAFYSSDAENFERIYAKYEADESFKKIWIDARKLLIDVLNEAYETGRSYLTWADEMNRHTPFKETIYSSNLCQEIMLPTKGYENMMDLYSLEDHGRGEVAMCNLAASIISNIETDEEYYEVMYYGLLMIDKTIHLSEYVLPHVGVTAKSRLSAGMGIMGLAHHMAKKGLKYSTKEGLEELHRVAERHSYMAIKASLQLGKELGNAPWMHKTKWPEGWLPIDTYNRSVDQVVAPVYQYDWEELRAEIIANGGIRNSVVVAYMPGEASSKAAGTTNSIYPIRALSLLKTDENTLIYWAAPESERLADAYEIAWDMKSTAQIDFYSVFFKFADQGISADLWRYLKDDDTVDSVEMLTDFFHMTRRGFKARYYQNLETSGTKEEKTISGGMIMEQAGPEPEEERGCAGGFCTL